MAGSDAGGREKVTNSYFVSLHTAANQAAREKKLAIIALVSRAEHHQPQELAR
jgi:hypothetical protein